MSNEVNKLAFGNNTYTISDEVARQAIAGLQTALDTSKDVIVKGKDPLIINANKDNITVSPGSYTSITVAGLGEDFTANNIAFNKSIGNINGVFTSDANATAEDIAKDKVAYVKGEKIVGTLEQSSAGSSELITKILDNTVTNVVDNDVTTIKYNCFEGNSNLVSVEFNNAKKINSRAFSSCTNLINVTIPQVTTLGSSCFDDTRNLKSLQLPNVTTIEDGVFVRCGVTELTLPSISSIYFSAFAQSNLVKIDLGGNFSRGIERTTFAACTDLQTLILRYTEAIVPLNNTTAFANSSIASGTGYVYVPKRLLNSYKTATNWSTYANQLRAIEDYPNICG